MFSRKPAFAKAPARRGHKVTKVYIIILIMAVMSCSVFAQQLTLPDDRAKITVNGDAVVYATPDKIKITLGIETQDQDIVMAKKNNNDILKKTIATIKACEGRPGLWGLKPTTAPS